MKRKILSFTSGLLILFLAVTMHINAPQAEAATQTEINQAITDGLAWLATQQQGDGRIGSGPNPVAYTAAAVLAFENEGHFPGSGTAYAPVVERGLNFIFN